MSKFSFWNPAPSGGAEPPAGAMVLQIETLSASQELILPAHLATVSITVDWGDGSGPEVFTTVDPSHTYTDAGTYPVWIYANGAGWEINRYEQQDGGDKEKFLACTSVGDGDVNRFSFHGCNNLATVDRDMFDSSPNISRISSLFRDCPITIYPTLPNSITHCTNAFQDCTSIVSGEALPAIPTSATTIQNMHLGNTSCDSSTIPTIPASVTNMIGYLSGCTAITATQCPTIGGNVVNMGSAFLNVPLTTIGTALDAATDVNDYNQTFKGCSLSAAEVDTMLISIDDNNTASTPGTYDYSAQVGDGHLDANRSGAASSAITSLNGKGWTRAGSY